MAHLPLAPHLLATVEHLPLAPHLLATVEHLPFAPHLLATDEQLPFPPQLLATAEQLPFPPQLLAKILQTLAKAGLLVSHAGTNGGYALARSAKDISAFEVIRAIDGPLFITSCITIHGTCDLAGHCTIKEPLRKVNDSITGLLSELRSADLVEAPEQRSYRRADHAFAGGLVSIAR